MGKRLFFIKPISTARASAPLVYRIILRFGIDAFCETDLLGRRKADRDRRIDQYYSLTEKINSKNALNDSSLLYYYERFFPNESFLPIDLVRSDNPLKSPLPEFSQMKNKQILNSVALDDTHQLHKLQFQIIIIAEVVMTGFLIQSSIDGQQIIVTAENVARIIWAGISQPSNTGLSFAQIPLEITILSVEGSGFARFHVARQLCGFMQLYAVNCVVKFSQFTLELLKNKEFISYYCQFLSSALPEDDHDKFMYLRRGCAPRIMTREWFQIIRQMRFRARKSEPDSVFFLTNRELYRTQFVGYVLCFSVEAESRNILLTDSIVTDARSGTGAIISFSFEEIREYLLELAWHGYKINFPVDRPSELRRHILGFINFLETYKSSDTRANLEKLLNDIRRFRDVLRSLHAPNISYVSAMEEFVGWSLSFRPYPSHSPMLESEVVPAATSSPPSPALFPPPQRPLRGSSVAIADAAPSLLVLPRLPLLTLPEGRLPNLTFLELARRAHAVGEVVVPEVKKEDIDSRNIILTVSAESPSSEWRPTSPPSVRRPIISSLEGVLPIVLPPPSPSHSSPVPSPVLGSPVMLDFASPAPVEGERVLQEIIKARFKLHRQIAEEAAAEGRKRQDVKIKEAE